MKIKILVTAFSLFVSIFAIAQETKSSSETFTPNGKPIIKVFSDFSMVNSNNMTNYAFEVQRAYFGYGYNFSKNISGKVVFDIANTGGLTPSAFTVFLKNAYASYACESFNADFGLIGTAAFKLQESFWGKRYLYKSFQDNYGFNSSADLGLSASYKIIPQLSVDLSVFNGEGYKKVQADSAFQFAAGLTAEPIKNLYVRLYGDYMKKNDAQSTLSAFVGYKCKKGSIGAEYNYQSGNKMTIDHNFSGISVYGNYDVVKKLSVFGRFDNIMSDKIGTSTSGWNTSDGQVYIAGLEYSPVKGIKIAPNVQYSNKTTGNQTTSFLVNLEMNL